MIYRNNINPLAYLNAWDIDRFEKFLNPSNNPKKNEEWKNDYNLVFRKYLMSGVNMPMDMKKYFTIILMLYPFRSNEENTFFKLNDNGKVGFLNKHLIKKAKYCKVPEAVMSRYDIIKKNYNSAKKYTSSKLGYEKNELSNFTYMIIEICFSKNTRDGKLEALLDD